MEVTAQDLVNLLEEDESVGTLYRPTYEFAPGGVMFKFNDIGTMRLVKKDLHYTIAAQVTTETHETGAADEDPFKARRFSLNVNWNESSGFVPDVIERNVRFLITKYRMIPAQ